MNPLTIYKTWNVTPEDGAWTVHTDDPLGTRNRYEDKREAVRRATALALEDRPSQVVVHSVDRDVSRCVIYDVQVDTLADRSGSELDLPEDPLPEADDRSRQVSA